MPEVAAQLKSRYRITSTQTAFATASSSVEQSSYSRDAQIWMHCPPTRRSSATWCGECKSNRPPGVVDVQNNDPVGPDIDGVLNALRIHIWQPDQDVHTPACAADRQRLSLSRSKSLCSASITTRSTDVRPNASLLVKRDNIPKSRSPRRHRALKDIFWLFNGSALQMFSAASKCRLDHPSSIFILQNDPSNIQRRVSLPLGEVRCIAVPLLQLHLDIGAREFVAQGGLEAFILVECTQRIQQIEG
ncbi:hypothetical protein SAMN05444158_0615 [Bradyrhizobium canariense]|uniref:Uncharacterized protein n=1 Tax=Bradyrhizobium canariense TaxID=255045 RepID=A0A1H1NGA9_9BRAD|nr:hypothetical protein SAMN05444158_0615 [Bradyrhizobium canariense]